MCLPTDAADMYRSGLIDVYGNRPTRTTACGSDSKEKAGQGEVFENEVFPNIERMQFDRRRPSPN
jgi:hypothetical protein